MEPKILLIDIETQPDLVYTWGVYEQNAISVKQHWQLLSYSAKWLGGKQTTKGLCDYPEYEPGEEDGDYRLVQEIWQLLDEADIVVAHNGIDFDIKKMNARFIAYGMVPPSPYKVVDTRKGLAQVAGFSSNKLDWICKQLGIGHKLEHEGWQLWLDCMSGDKKAWAKMKKYNAHDVTLLEDLYLTIAPWIRQPNAGVWKEDDVCPNPACGSKHLEHRGVARNKTMTYQRFQCKDCGAWGRAALGGKRTAGVVPA